MFKDRESRIKGDRLRGQHSVEKILRLLLFFEQQPRSFRHQIFKIVGVFFHHFHHLIHNVSLPENQMQIFFFRYTKTSEKRVGKTDASKAHIPSFIFFNFARITENSGRISGTSDQHSSMQLAT